MTREELYKSDLNERSYYESKRPLKERIRLPITKDGCEALLEVVTKSLEIPLDDTTRQVFGGYVHHLPQTENSTTLGEVGKVLYKNMANFATWSLDQEAKERRQLEEAKKKAQEQIQLVKDTDDSQGEQATVQ